MSDRFVTDSSIAIAWYFEDESTDDYAEHVLDAFGSAEAIAPAIWPLEIGNVLLVAERRKRLTRADSIRFLELVGGLPIYVEQESPERMLKEILALGRELELTTYDASYIDLAMRTGLPIATLDERLKIAAEQCAVPLFRPSRSMPRE